ncbi:MAG TPA: DUF4062 domain-containing protein [Thermodesulfovibrionia bacterium]|nr:DUF4062 domain-containing protein [Thermodesulfovibrionia bacterium]
MPSFTFQKIRLFLSSPGDVQEERTIVHKIVSEINLNHSDNYGLHLDVIDWKTHALHGMGRGQEMINPLLDDCDIFVGILWKYFGTPTGQALSGTEEEFKIAYGKWKRLKKPHILFYFCKADVGMPDDMKALEQMGKVLSFKKRFSNENPGLYQEYKTVEDFGTLVRRHLVNLLKQWKAQPPPLKPDPKTADFTDYLTSLKDDTMYIDIRRLVAGYERKIPHFYIEYLFFFFMKIFFILD